MLADDDPVLSLLPYDIRGYGLRIISALELFSKHLLQHEPHLFQRLSTVDLAFLNNNIESAAMRSYVQLCAAMCSYALCVNCDALLKLLQGMHRWERCSAPFTQSIAGVNTGSTQAGSPAMLDLLSTLGSAQRGLLIVAELTTPADVVAALSIAKTLGWPVVADALSGKVSTSSGCCLCMICGMWVNTTQLHGIWSRHALDGVRPDLSAHMCESMAALPRRKS